MSGLLVPTQEGTRLRERTRAWLKGYGIDADEVPELAYYQVRGFELTQWYSLGRLAGVPINPTIRREVLEYFEGLRHQRVS